MMKYRLLLLLILGVLCLMPAAAQPEIEATIPDAMPLVVMPAGQDISIFLLFGTATDNPANPGLADTLLLVAVNRTTNSAAMLAIPRDLWAYVPGYGMKKLNSAWYLAETHTPGTGADTLKAAVRYNLGIEVDYYAHIDFNGFLSVIDTLGGIDLAVDCTIYDWKLKSRELNKLVAENYEMTLLPVGMHHLDADSALWYVRSRFTSSDLDRGRRQQDVLRAVWRKIRQSDVLGDLPTLWEQATRSVDTDLTLADALGFLPFATGLDADRITTYRFKMGDHIRNAWSPSPERAAILAPERAAVQTLIQTFVTPPTPNQVTRAALTVQIVNASGVERLEYVAADRLAQEGFVPIIVDEVANFRNYNAIYDYTGSTKGGALPSLQRVLRVTDEGVTLQPDPNRTADYKIYIGHQYLYWSCTRDVIQPRLKLDETGKLVVDDVVDDAAAGSN
ncbi:MAG: LCP family protein [Armatimonadetes bacterium]|nr:LCP family protein [Anaerolineae bacterium]